MSGSLNKWFKAGPQAPAGLPQVWDGATLECRRPKAFIPHLCRFARISAELRSWPPARIGLFIYIEYTFWYFWYYFFFALVMKAAN